MQETQVQSLGWEDSLETGMANPLWYSCLENSKTEKTGGLHIIHWVAQSQTRLSNFTSGQDVHNSLGNTILLCWEDSLGNMPMATQRVS